MEKVVFRFVLAALVAAALGCGQALAQSSLDDTAIRSLLVGKSALFADYSVATYSEGGGYAYVAANNLYFRGKYTVADGKLCFAVDGGQKRCDTVRTDGQGPFLVAPTGAIFRFTALSAPPALQVSKLCGVDIAYTIYPPAADVPRNVADFSGAWIGTWDYGMCGAMIVESVQADGSASAIYVNGEFGPDHPFKAGALRFPAKIVAKTLSDGGVQTRFDAVMSGANELAITRVGPPGQGKARFHRTAGR